MDNQSSATQSDEEAIKRAKAKLKKAIADKKAGKTVEAESSLNQATKEDSQTAGSVKVEKPNDDELDDGIHIRKVKVYSPYKIYFDGPATSVTAENDTGVFDILPRHKNFMSIVKASEIIVRTDKGEERIKTNSAVMHVSKNVVRIFLDV